MLRQFPQARLLNIFLAGLLCAGSLLRAELTEPSIFERKNAPQLNTQRFQEGSVPFTSNTPSSATPSALGAPEQATTTLDEVDRESDFIPDTTPMEYVKAYEGRWVGTLTITTMDGQKLNAFEVEQQYWWNEEKQKLESLAVFDDAGIMRYAQSSNYVDEEGVIYSEVEEANQKKIYKAKVDKATIVWLPLDKKRALDHQLKQRIFRNEEGIFMENKGFERYKRGNIDKMLLLTGTLRKDATPAEIASTTIPADKLPESQFTPKPATAEPPAEVVAATPEPRPQPPVQRPALTKPQPPTATVASLPPAKPDEAESSTPSIIPFTNIAGAGITSLSDHKEPVFKSQRKTQSSLNKNEQGTQNPW